MPLPHTRLTSAELVALRLELDVVREQVASLKDLEVDALTRIVRRLEKALEAARYLLSRAEYRQRRH